MAKKSKSISPGWDHGRSTDDSEDEETWRKTWDEIQSEYRRLAALGVGRDLAARMAYDEVVLKRVLSA